MGVVRSVPDKEIKFQVKLLQKFDIIMGKTCGWQYFMEDYSFFYQYSKNIFIVGLIDGLSGPQVAEFCQNQIPLILSNCDLMKLQQYQGAIQNLCFTLDLRIKQNHHLLNKIRSRYNLPQLPVQQQTPSSASLIICIIDNQSVTIGNLGECKCYTSYKYSQQKAVLISGNHIIQRDQDIQDILKKKSFVIDNMINGKYRFTKCIGNLKFKNLESYQFSLISSQPSVFSLRLQDLNMIVLGTSGLWQRGELVLNEILKGKMQINQLKIKIQHAFQELVAESPEQQLGRQNISIAILKIK